MGVHHHKSPIVIDGLIFQVDADNDLSGNVSNVRNIITPTETGSFVNGASVVNGEYDFDGVDDYIDFGATLNLTSSYTLDFWFNTSRIAATNGQILGRFDGGFTKGFVIRMSTSQKLQFFHVEIGDTEGTFTSNSITSPLFYNDSVWYNCVAKFEVGVGSQLFVNAVIVGTDNTTTLPISSYANNLILGNRTAGGSQPWEGELSNFKAYNRALTPTEIQQNYNATKNKYH